MKLRNKHFGMSVMFQKLPIVLFFVFCHFEFSITQKIPPLPPALVKKFEALQNVNDGYSHLNKGRNNGDGQVQSFHRNIFKAKLLAENFAPSFLTNLFKSTEDFESFAISGGGGLFSGVNDLCRNHSLEVLHQLLGAIGSIVPGRNITVPDDWVLQMVDAWGKFPAGLLSGHTAIPGDFHECLRIRGTSSWNQDGSALKKTSNFKGRYCSTSLVPGAALLALINSTSTQSSKSNLYEHIVDFNLRDEVTSQLIANSFGANIDVWLLLTYLFTFVGTCFPSTCSTDDVRTIFDNFYKNTTQGYLEQSVMGCYTDEKPPFDAADITVITILSVIGFLCLIGSLYDVALYRRQTESASGSSLGTKILLSFSVPLNTSKLLSTRVGSDNLGCLHGLRFWSMAWVVLSHTFEMSYFGFTWNMFDILNSYRDWKLLPVMNGTVSVDTFFTISGALMAYNLLRELDRNKGKFNYPLMVLHRFLRLTPTYMLIVGMMATILPYFGSGPKWYIMDEAGTLCEEKWWYNALYITNFLSQFDMCYGESWYLANDMQFFILAPLIIYPLWRWSKVGLGILGAFSIASILAPASIQIEKKLPPTQVPFIGQKTYMDDLYYTPWVRMGPYLVGLFLGYILYLKTKSPATFRSIPTWAVAVGWLLSTASALLLIFADQSFFDPANEYWTWTSTASAAYAGLLRFVWGMVISWIIFACVSGYGGWVNQFLSWKVFMPLGRLTFCVYISSFHLQQFYHLTQTHPIHYSLYGTVNVYFAHVVMALLVGYLLTITLESPFIQLEKLLLQPKKQNSKVKTGELPTN